MHTAPLSLGAVGGWDGQRGISLVHGQCGWGYSPAVMWQVFSLPGPCCCLSLRSPSTLVVCACTPPLCCPDRRCGRSRGWWPERVAVCESSSLSSWKVKIKAEGHVSTKFQTPLTRYSVTLLRGILKFIKLEKATNTKCSTLRLSSCIR
jgi:hypothetical protein